MTSKATKAKRDAHYIEEVRYVRELSDAVSALMPTFRLLSPPVTAFHHVGPFGPNPNNHTIWFVVTTRTEVQEAETTGLQSVLLERLRDKLQQCGYPSSGIQTLQVLITSQKDIDDGGGSFFYFR